MRRIKPPLRKRDPALEINQLSEFDAERTAHEIARPAIVVIIIDYEQITKRMMNKVEAYVRADQSGPTVILD